MSVTMSDTNETLIRVMKKPISMPPDVHQILSDGNRDYWNRVFGDPPVKGFLEIVVNENGHKVNMTDAEYGLSETIKWCRLEDKAKFDSPGDRKLEHCEMFDKEDITFYKPARRTRKDWTSSRNEVFGDPPVKGFLEIVENKNGHKFNMSEYNLWIYMPEELKDKLIQMCPEKAEVVERLRSWARKRKAKAKAASRASQEHTNPETGGGSSTAQNGPPPNHQSFPVVVDHQVNNVQVNGSMADNEPAEHINPETGGGSSTAQNEPPPSHQSPPVGGDHQVHNVEVNRSLNESSDVESGTLSTQAGNEPASDKCRHETLLAVAGEIISILLGGISFKNSAGETTIEEKIFLYFLLVFIFLGIISLSYSLWLSGGGGRGGRPTVVARVVNAVSYIATGLAVVTAAGLQLPNLAMVCVIPLVWGIIAPAIVCYAIKQ